MKTFLIAIVMFVVGFFVWGSVGVNLTLSSGYDYMVKYLWDVNALPSNATSTMKALYEKSKDQMVKDLTAKKDEIINSIKESVKEQLKKQIENIFG